MNDKQLKNRRRILIGLTGASGLSQVPVKWHKPMVDVVVLPSHGETTAGTGGDPGGGTTAAPTVFNYSGLDIPQVFSDAGSARSGDSWYVRALDSVVSPADAGTTPLPTTTPSPLPTTTPSPPTTDRPANQSDWNVAVNGNQAVVTVRSNNGQRVRRGTLIIGGGAVNLAQLDGCLSPGTGPLASVANHNPGVNISISVSSELNFMVTVPLGPARSFSAICDD